jgi:hypothetical protein
MRRPLGYVPRAPPVDFEEHTDTTPFQAIALEILAIENLPPIPEPKMPPRINKCRADEAHPRDKIRRGHM